MILIPVDEAVAFDRLAILYVKNRHGLNVETQIHELERHLNRQVEHVENVLESAEYHRLLDANELTFQANTLAHNDDIKASTLQEINGRRYMAKRALQEKFWPNLPLSEIKNGLTISR